MWIPRSQPMRIPILQFLSSFPPEREVYVEEIVEHLREHLREHSNLTEEAAAHPQFRRNAGGALSGLKQDGRPKKKGLIERTCKDHYRITERGREWLDGGVTGDRPPTGGPPPRRRLQEAQEPLVQESVRQVCPLQRPVRLREHGDRPHHAAFPRWIGCRRELATALSAVQPEKVCEAAIRSSWNRSALAR